MAPSDGFASRDCGTLRAGAFAALKLETENLKLIPAIPTQAGTPALRHCRATPLPLGGELGLGLGLEFVHLGTHFVPRDGVHAVDEEDALEMVVLVLDGARQ